MLFPEAEKRGERAARADCIPVQAVPAREGAADGANAAPSHMEPFSISTAFAQIEAPAKEERSEAISHPQWRDQSERSGKQPPGVGTRLRGAFPGKVFAGRAVPGCAGVTRALRPASVRGCAVSGEGFRRDAPCRDAQEAAGRFARRRYAVARCFQGRFPPGAPCRGAQEAAGRFARRRYAVARCFQGRFPPATQTAGYAGSRRALRPASVRGCAVSGEGFRRDAPCRDAQEAAGRFARRRYAVAWCVSGEEKRPARGCGRGVWARFCGQLADTVAPALPSAMASWISCQTICKLVWTSSVMPSGASSSHSPTASTRYS